VHRAAIDPIRQVGISLGSSLPRSLGVDGEECVELGFGP
jgi:hypothetical protein